jgi:ABC-type uncharacterized transport system YnjBCD ATPase subunit
MTILYALGCGSLIFFAFMAYNFSRQFSVDGKTLLAVIVPELRKDGMYYEVNIKGYPRFKMTWSALDRFDITGDERNVPYNIVLAVSDLLEEERKKY